MENAQGGEAVKIDAFVATVEESDAAILQTRVYKNRIQLCWTKCEVEGCERSCFNFRNCDDRQFGYTSSSPGGLCSVHVIAKRSATTPAEVSFSAPQPVHLDNHPQESWNCKHAWSCIACAFLNSDMALQSCSACQSPRFSIRSDCAIPARPLKIRRTEFVCADNPPRVFPAHNEFVFSDCGLSDFEGALYPVDESTEDEDTHDPSPPALNPFPIESDDEQSGGFWFKMSHCDPPFFIENADQLLRRIEQHDPNFTKLEILESSRCWSLRVIIGEFGCAAMARVLPLNSSITSLSFENSELGPAGACLLFPALTHLTALAYLNLSCTELRSAGATHLCSALRHLTALTELNLGQNKLTADDGARICSAAAGAGLRRLQRLVMHDNHFSSASDVVACEEWGHLNLPQPPHDFIASTDFSSLVQYLMSDDKAAFTETHHPDLPAEFLQRIERNDPGLTKLEVFYKSKFNEIGCRVLARSLSLNARITSLDIEYTSVGPAGACLLFPALTHLTALAYLKLYDTDLRSAGAAHFCSALRHLTALTELNLGQNKLTADDGARICSAAAGAGLRRLRFLYFGYEAANKFNSESVVESKLWEMMKLPKPSHDILQKCMDSNILVHAKFFNNYVPLVRHIFSHFERCCMHAHLVQAQKEYDLALPLYEDVLHIQRNVFGLDHPISKLLKHMRDMCVFSAFGYSLGIISALSACDFMAAEIKQLHLLGFIAPVSGYWRVLDASMRHEERLRVKCSGAVGLLVKRMTSDSSTVSALSQKLKQAKRNQIFNTMRILHRVVNGNAAARLAIEIKW